MIGRFIPSVVLSSDWPCQPVLSLHSLFNLTLDKTYPTGEMASANALVLGAARWRLARPICGTLRSRAFF